MSYKNWFENHSTKHKNIINKLENYSQQEIIEYFRFENMVINEPDFCALYKENTKCHDIENLNCYLCACPYFRVLANKSECSIDSKNGSKIESKDNFIHQDCSKCTIPHKEKFINKNFSKDWKFIMKDCIKI
jgi:Zn-finger protein